VRRWLALLVALLPAACQFGAAPRPHVAVGAAYRADGMWHYPRRRLSGSRTGLATILAGDHAAYTANGEAFDPEALAAASPDLQMPAIVRVTNLANGLALTVRVNDRGPRAPGRLLAVTPRAARLLGFPASGIARVRMTVLAAPSQIAADALAGGPSLAVAADPVGAVASAPLGPPGAGGAAPPAPGPAPATAPRAAGTIAPVLSGRLTRVTPAPGALWVRLNRFTVYQYAAVLAARLAGLHASIARGREGTETVFTVRLGPFAHVADADVALRAALAAGVAAPRIVIEAE